MRQTLVILASSFMLVGAKCVDYDPALVPTPATVQTPSTCDPNNVTPTVDGMRQAACAGLRCASERVATYWHDVWEQYDNELTLTFRDPASGAFAMDVVDSTGQPTTLDLQVGVPVTLTVISPADVASVHDLTAVPFFRTVAWDMIRTVDTDQLAPTIDAVVMRADASVTHQVVLRFVPIVAGTYTAYSSQGVTNGDAYAQLATGGVTPDLSTGDAGKGMTTTVSVTGPALTLFVETDPERPSALASDPRRLASDPVWAAPELVTISASEGFNNETGDPVYHYAWSTTTLTRDSGYRLQLVNPATNTEQHNLSAPGLLRDAVLRGSVDSQAEVRAPAWVGTNVNSGSTAELLIVPTVATTYTAYCRLGVVYGESGHPDLTTGHPGAGMLDSLTVVGP